MRVNKYKYELTLRGKALLAGLFIFFLLILPSSVTYYLCRLTYDSPNDISLFMRNNAGILGEKLKDQNGFIRERIRQQRVDREIARLQRIEREQSGQEYLRQEKLRQEQIENENRKQGNPGREQADTVRDTSVAADGNPGELYNKTVSVIPPNYIILDMIQSLKDKVQLSALTPVSAALQRNSLAQDTGDYPGQDINSTYASIEIISRGDEAETGSEDEGIMRPMSLDDTGPDDTGADAGADIGEADETGTEPEDEAAGDESEEATEEEAEEAGEDLRIFDVNAPAELQEEIREVLAKHGYLHFEKLMYGVMDIETGGKFNPDAKSHDGYYGLLQISPYWITSTATRNGVVRFEDNLSGRSLFNARDNILTGIEIWAYCIDRYELDIDKEEDIIKLLYWHNTGKDPTNIKSWRYSSRAIRFAEDLVELDKMNT